MIPINTDMMVRQVVEYDPIFGDQQPAKPKPPEQAIIDDAYLIFASAQGRMVLDDLIQRYIAAPIFDGTRDAAKGYERNGEANVVREIVRRLAEAQRAIEQRNR